MNKTEKADSKGYIFIRNMIMNSGITPSLRVIAQRVGYNSPRSVQLMLERLKNRGLISYSNGVIQLSLDSSSDASEQTIGVPLVGSIACGFPLLAEQETEAVIQISTKIAKSGHNYFLLRAKGNSMNLSGINDGDLVLVRKQQTAEGGDRVVALINNDATIKHFQSEENVIILKPNSSETNHQPVVLSEDFVIQGVVTAVLPKSII